MHSFARKILTSALSKVDPELKAARSLAESYHQEAMPELACMGGGKTDQGKFDAMKSVHLQGPLNAHLHGGGGGCAGSASPLGQHCSLQLTM